MTPPCRDPAEAEEAGDHARAETQTNGIDKALPDYYQEAFVRATPRPEDNPELVKAAIDALRRWRWEPGPGSMLMTHTINFRLATDEKK